MPSFSHLSVQDLERALALSKERESIQAQIDRINNQLLQLEKGKDEQSISDDQETVAAPEKKRRRHRKNIEEAVVKALQSAGANGLTVKELALQAKIKATSLTTWIYTRAKSLPKIKKIKPGVFAYHAE